MDFVRSLRTFMRVAESGSFALAAEQLETSGAAVSRQIAALEEHLQARLLNRTTRKVSLTSSGQAFVEKARHILQAIEEAESFAGERPEAISGVLRLAAPLSFGLAHLAPLLSGFRQRHPKLKLDVDLSDRTMDLTAHGFDLALRIAREPSPQLVARRIAPVRLALCASPGYLQARGTPTHPQELAQHETLSYSFLASGETWVFSDGQGDAVNVRISPSVSATNGDVLRDLAVAGAGIVLQPTFIVDGALARGALVRLLPQWQAPELHLYAVYLTQRQLSAKVRAFVDYLVESMGEPPERAGP